MAVKIFLGKPPAHVENWIKNHSKNNNDSYTVYLTNNSPDYTLFGRFEGTKEDYGDIVLSYGDTRCVESYDMNTRLAFNVKEGYDVDCGFEDSDNDYNAYTTTIEFNPARTRCSVTAIRYNGSGCGDSGCGDYGCGGSGCGDYGCGCGGSGCGDYGCGCGGSGCGGSGCGDYGCGCGGSGCGESYRIQINNQTNFEFATSDITGSLYIPANGTAYANVNNGFVLGLPVSHLKDPDNLVTLQISRSSSDGMPEYYNVSDYDTIPIQITAQCAITISQQ